MVDCPSKGPRSRCNSTDMSSNPGRGISSAICCGIKRAVWELERIKIYFWFERYQDGSCDQEDQISDEISIVALEISSGLKALHEVVGQQEEADRALEAEVGRCREDERLGGLRDLIELLRVCFAKLGHEFLDLIGRDGGDQPQGELAGVGESRLLQAIQDGPLVLVEGGVGLQQVDNEMVGRGLHSTELAFLLLTQWTWVLFSAFPRNYFDVAEIYRQCWLEES